MKIIHQNGYTREELVAFRPGIRKNTLECMQSLVLAIRNLSIPYHNALCVPIADDILKFDLHDPPYFDEAFGEKLQTILLDDACAKAMEMSSHFYIMDSAP